ncbi:MAG: 1-deoxy-D-xylulose-5-phosphate reductoisomerase [Treponema sp.]|jgi:1-deoxy-D-xylulose-5-phosphate reductoisomerase|nr:1-deoxy-D-xylulose-5-phosphate reductoisomerase [Treponema sp.]
MKRRIALLGATGSIGKSVLQVIRAANAAAGDDAFEVILLSAHTGREALAPLGDEFPGARLVLSGAEGPAALTDAIGELRPDITVNGIAGAAGLLPSVAAIRAGSDLALANKETVVMAGDIILPLAAEKKVRVLPVDSEHSAIFNLLNAHGREGVEELILTASGGPFRKLGRGEMERVRPADALAHPTWKMGPKITIDSASMANKGLEVIEAVRLFGFPPEKVKVLIHPQSVVHSMIRMKDGAVYAQLSGPDMRLPIHEALCHPAVKGSSFGTLDFDALTLEFEKPDFERFPMLPLAWGAIRRGGLYPCVYNAANEAAAAAFLSGKAGFLDIPVIVGYVLNMKWEGSGTAAGRETGRSGVPRYGPAVEAVLETDERARSAAAEFIRNRFSGGRG